MSDSFTVNDAPFTRHWIQLFWRAVRRTSKEGPETTPKRTNTFGTGSYTVLTVAWFGSSARQRKCFPKPLSFLKLLHFPNWSD